MDFINFQVDDPNKKLRIEKANGESLSVDVSENGSPAESLTGQVDNYDSSNETLIVDCDSLSNSSSQTFLVEDLAHRKQKYTTRGAKRGRPRGSRRGNRGGIGRSDARKTNPSSDLSEQNQFPAQMRGASKIRRGPGRPRLKLNGPNNQAHRQLKYRKPICPVPLAVSLGSTSVQTSPTKSSNSPK